MDPITEEYQRRSDRLVGMIQEMSAHTPDFFRRWEREDRKEAGFARFNRWLRFVEKSEGRVPRILERMLVRFLQDFLGINMKSSAEEWERYYMLHRRLGLALATPAKDPWRKK